MKKFLFVFAVLGLLATPLSGGVLLGKASAADELPAWVKNVKFKGDVRVRYQDEEQDKSGKENERFRIRLRAGIDAEVNENWSAGFGFASGGGDPRSTNQTLANFETGDARLDYAYAQFKYEMLKMVFGKFKNPIWNPKDLLWDSDIMPDGMAASLDFKASENASLFITPAFFVLNQWSKDTDSLPSIVALQAGGKMEFKDAGRFKIAGTYYAVNDVEGNDWSKYSKKTNSIDAAGKWINDHDAFSLEAEAGLTNLPIYVAAYGQYVVADVDDDDTGYLFGIKFGKEKIKTLGDWQANVNYRNLEKDAWLDFLPDSDIFGGSTGVKGMEVEFTVGLHKNVTLGLDYYRTEEIDGNEEEDLLQLDLVVKFP